MPDFDFLFIIEFLHGSVNRWSSSCQEYLFSLLDKLYMYVILSFDSFGMLTALCLNI